MDFWQSNEDESNDRAVLRLTYISQNTTTMIWKVSDCFHVTFVKKPYNITRIDFIESGWINTLHAKIDINKTVLSIAK